MSMLLSGHNGNEFELGFIRDSLPEAQDGLGDANLVTATFRFASQTAAWEEDAPGLNVFEFNNLADWLAALSDDMDTLSGPSDIDLLQPELRFSVTDQSKDEVT